MTDQIHSVNIEQPVLRKRKKNIIGLKKNPKVFIGNQDF